jgi:cell division protein FtsL
MMNRIDRLTGSLRANAYSQTPWRRQIQILGLFSLVLVLVALVAGIYLNVTARASTVGREIQDLQREIEALQKDNADLQARLAQLNSAGEMEARARSLGFQRVNTDETVYMVVPGYTGRQPVILAPSTSPDLVSAPMLPPQYTESLFVWLKRQIDTGAFGSLAFWEDRP